MHSELLANWSAEIAELTNILDRGMDGIKRQLEASSANLDRHLLELQAQLEATKYDVIMCLIGSIISAYAFVFAVICILE
ncbi:hypothetical protein L1987_42193 [Smallanthus sonchifolius]|uniref:Uncharacterized protein n=1 Tax=Smallanthus sonchifolius TaxID=185202 RepID=A0ACB9GVT1_9ASTR|nr:hypothetical protein L1987_42193 [Smallanthus sonchifolius]